MPCTPVAVLAALFVATSARAQDISVQGVDRDLHAIAQSMGESHAELTAARPPAHPAAELSAGGRLLFVSRGMPQAELVAAVDAAAADPQLTLVLRGLLPGESLTEAMRALARLLG